ncbi:MAG TPA: hypothetical protein VGQ76_06235 [Thermoanaerobaculia bacterium]|nr:hypothetical protein [Thermoanaerobaculia bacterium]
MRIVWDYFGHMRTWDAMRRYVLLDLGKVADDEELTLAEARSLVARAQGFETWDGLADDAAAASPDVATKVITVHSVGDVERSRNWNDAIATMARLPRPGLDASGQMTDALLERVSRVAHTAALDLSSSNALTDDRLRSLSRLQELRHLNLSGCGVSDRGMEVLRSLPRLESIDLTRTRTGDGTIRALAGKTALSPSSFRKRRDRRGTRRAARLAGVQDLAGR